MACGGSDLDLVLVKEEPQDEQSIKDEVDIEEHELLQHPRVRAALPHLALGGGLPAPAESQLPPAEISVSAGIEALPDTRHAAPERYIKLEPGLSLGKSCNEVAKTEKDAYVADRWFGGRLCSSRSAHLHHQQAHCAPECDDAPRPPEGAGDKAVRRYECDICHYTSKIRTNIVRHLRTHTTGEKPFKCNLCDYRSVYGCLTRHMRTHSGEKPFKCNLCDYRSIQSSSLTKHMRTHSGEKPFKCSLCDFRSFQRSNLTTHMRSHTGEKPFKCSVCEYRCNQKGNISSHMRTHTGEKPFKCSVCEYRCNQKGSISSHMRTHTGEKPFKCSLCDYRSVQSHNLSDHMKTHTGEKPFKCHLCDYRSARRGGLTRHMRTHSRL